MTKKQHQYLMKQLSEQGAAQELEIQQNMFKSQSAWHAASLNAINAVADRTANSVTGLIMGTQSLADVMRSASATILQTMVQTLMEVTVKRGSLVARCRFRIWWCRNSNYARVR
ncbi:hypothetical protein PCI56_12670 [Plesiomonas shigelloides subsp. oncorhynchi]|nr:hypothetical protein [Plesiomonas shigelloides]